MKKLLFYIGLSLFLPTYVIANDCNHVMDNDRMSIIINQMENKSDDIKKLNIIKTYLQRLCFNTSQMLSIIEVFESEEAKNDFFIYAKEYILDIENYNELNN